MLSVFFLLINAEGNGIVEYVDACKITVRYNFSPEEKLMVFDDELKTYELTKFKKTNQNTPLNFMSHFGEMTLI